MFMHLEKQFGIRVSVQDFKGKRRFDLRLYGLKDGEWRPTKVGLVVPIDRIDEFVDGIVEVRDEYKREQEEMKA